MHFCRLKSLFFFLLFRLCIDGSNELHYNSSQEKTNNPTTKNPPTNEENPPKTTSSINPPIKDENPSNPKFSSTIPNHIVIDEIKDTYGKNINEKSISSILYSKIEIFYAYLLLFIDCMKSLLISLFAHFNCEKVI